MARDLTCVVFAFVSVIAISAATIEGKGVGSQLNHGEGTEGPIIDVESVIQKRFYYGIFFKASWYMASMYCRHRGMQLASINSEKEQHQLEDDLEKHGDLNLDILWISGKKVNASGPYVWDSGRTKTPMTYSKWFESYPIDCHLKNGPVKECGCITVWRKQSGLYGWSNSGCDNSYYFVCEITDFNAYSNHCLTV